MTAPLRLPTETESRNPQGNTPIVVVLQRLLMAGMAWLIIGMAVMPSSISFNPSKAYQIVLALTMWLPTLALIAMRPKRVVDVCKMPTMPWVIALLAWGCVSLAWSHAPHRGDEAMRDFSIFLFLIACHWVFGGNEARTRWLLVNCALVLAAVSVFDIVEFALHPPTDDRLIGIGVMGNANLAAAGMGAGLIWLWPWRAEGWRWVTVKWLAISTLALFILLTFTRSAWAALFGALVVMVLCRGGRRAWLYAGVICVLGVLGVVAGFHVLMERGLSLRPEIFAKSLDMFLQHPLRGLGQGTAFTIEAGNETLDHAHNMFAQLAIELGLPAVLMWLGIWLALGWRAWRHRHDALGLIVLGLWVFGSIAVEFDLPHLLDSPRPGWLITWLPLALSWTFARPNPAKRSA
ncbi:O-antigen ligase family protein [Dyella sp. 2HG41-7]|uniref:O-antigen ligase family protein n=1 Tax=Dyella sp. 2HG41-7 TaxID=2883239 RepID=UPI001F2A3231|nr:O-antigen ligase family protein [Dyella sp. 2HG41-7]